MNKLEYQYTWSLGDDYYCDTCGGTWNQIGIELWDDEPKNIWQLWTRTGCTGGEAVMSVNPDWEKEANDIIKRALEFPNFTKSDAKELKAIMAIIKSGDYEANLE